MPGELFVRGSESKKRSWYCGIEFTELSMEMGVIDTMRTEQGAEIPEEPKLVYGFASEGLHRLARRSSHDFRFLSKGMLVCAPTNAGDTGNEARDTSEKERGGLGIFGGTWSSEPFGALLLPSVV